MIDLFNNTSSHPLKPKIPLQQHQHLLLPSEDTPRSPHTSTNDSMHSIQGRLPTQKPEKANNCSFKIRSFNSKKTTKTSSIEGKRIGNFLIVSGKTKPQTKEDITALVINRFSARSSPSQKNNTQKQKIDSGKQTIKPREKNVFKHIDIFQSTEKIELKFTNIFNQLHPLAHQASVKYNFNEENMQKRWIVIFSTQLLFQPAQRYFDKTRQKSKDKNIANSRFCAQATTILKNLSGKQGPKSFLNHCKLYYKTSSQCELQDLNQYLQENNLLQYSGIINVKKTYSQGGNIYNLNWIKQKDQSFIFIEDEQTLGFEMPALSQAKSVFIVPRQSNFFVVNQLIQSLKAIECQEIVTSPSKSPQKRNKNNNEFQLDVNKENLHPNFLQTITKTQNKSPHKGKISPSKLDSTNMKSSLRQRQQRSQKRFKLFITGNVKIAHYNSVVQKMATRVHQNMEMRQFKKIKRAAREQLCSERDYSTQNIKINHKKERSISRSKYDPLNVNANSLEGSFKEKMVAYVKILESQKQAQTLQKKQRPITGIQFKEKQTDLQELTSCLTSKLKSKTPYQMVGELLRNNSHIAKQIGSYVASYGVYSELLHKIQTKKIYKQQIRGNLRQQGRLYPHLQVFYFQ